MPKKASSNRMPAGSQDAFQNQSHEQPAGGGGMPQIDVNVNPGGVDVMAQMSSPTGIQSSQSHDEHPDGHHQKQDHHGHKHSSKFEDAQPHGHDLRHHHGYNLRVHATK